MDISECGVRGLWAPGTRFPSGSQSVFAFLSILKIFQKISDTLR